MLDLTYATFQETLDAHPLVLVDFFAPWCAPCAKMRPVLEAAQAQLPQVLCASVDVDQEDDLAVENEISLLPTLVLYREGKEAQRIVGTLTLEQLAAKLKL